MTIVERPPLISVIMPCFNAVPYLDQAISSVLSQSHDNVELIVVDDGSTDGSREYLACLAKQYGEQITVLHQQRQGPYPARNRALRQARGAYVAFLDADDYWTPEFLSRMYAALIAKNADIAYCGWQNIGNDGLSDKPYVPPCYEAGDMVALFLRDCPWPIHAALIRRPLLDSVGGFSERFFSSMDYDLWLRLSAVTRNLVQVPEVMAYYRWHHNGQISSIKWKQVLISRRLKQDFIEANPDAVAHLNHRTLRQLTDGYLLRAGYTAFWRRDLEGAHQLFRNALFAGHWEFKDLKYLLPALLPSALYSKLVDVVDRHQTA